jgi:hypothetical protein
MSELVWAAGFFDGEGHIGFILRKDTRCTLGISVNQVEPEPLVRFMRAVGGGAINGPYIPKNRPTSRPLHQYRAYGPVAFEVFTNLKPHLCTIKTLQGEDAILRWQQYRDRKLISDVYEMVGPVDVLITHHALKKLGNDGT